MKENREAIIQLINATIGYGDLTVVNHVDMVVYQGETKVILGPSGVGKSTILKAILGLIKPTTGEIRIHRENIVPYQERELVRIRSQMAMVFQHGALFDSMTVGENVSYRLRELEMTTPDKIDQRVDEVLNFVGLRGARKLKPAQLSGGMRKRVAIARGLAPDPEVFLFDEPTVGLDPINHFNIEQLMLKLKKTQRATMLIVTHDVESALRLADSIVILHEGQFIFDGTPTALKENQDMRVKAFLDPEKFATARE
ncbi:MAG: ABC transporter ATP-binding protein [Candidatus Omnitrophica bacterium CG11_big_fil_rev_8_21_14_0_20_45_26]|uniref:ABC transporter ATP-binding protein n=1 Tax=Candidatus Abzuiibacterium crystallinum TaxID=1974748 RepID=A0A2H0LT03_9BACT|nr:MAG: ABC transporter ATP-binding protein [Candidatus Omnitrophica bacterium CG11_big_fil_rev_8_21_14_0_20_45_26]PIW64605.1 MAG: ABC transporter ATP-binding protein [Candidatus Omnitrophica bacterium CG12_big_fil_rev_8_21_14_0_65_45_16]